MGTLALRRTSFLPPFVLDRGVCFLSFCYSFRTMIAYYTAEICLLALLFIYLIYFYFVVNLSSDAADDFLN